MTTMSRELYDVAAAIAGTARAGYLPHPRRVAGPVPHTLPPQGKAVYIAVDGAGVIRYVGSVCRLRATGLSERATEHIRDWFKERHWVELYTVPLRPDTSPADVRSIEGRIGRRLKPVDNKRLPRGVGR